MAEIVHKTCLEKQMFGYLKDLGLEPRIDFFEQYPYSSYLLDFAIIKSRKPFRGLDIETDGLKWHSTSKQRKRDGYRTYRLIKAGWLIERVGENFSITDVQDILVKHEIEIPVPYVGYGKVR